ncbi:MAG: hypothetical protein KAG97_00330 [Victivallales bacterium]|nr:hypothetical protein [Victivallales bacterium]
MKKKLILVSLVISIMTPLAPFLSAGSWNWSKPYQNPKKRVNTLIVIGNYMKPRLMADLIQIETRQPILLLPANAEGKIYFVPSKDETLVISSEDLQSFIKYLSPGKILVLGDKKFVPERFVKKIDPTQTVIKVENEKWEKIASMVTNIINLTYLDRRYKKYAAKIDSGELYRPEWADSLEPADKIGKKTNKDDLVVEETIIVDDVDSSNAQNNDAPDMKTSSEPKLIDDTKVVPK